MKPIPPSQEAWEEEVKSLTSGIPLTNASPVIPRAKLCYFMEASKKINCSLNRCSILLVGSSGVGKSSTINHLLRSNISATSSSKSETKTTSEFIVTADDPKFEVSGLKLGIVDTPGFNDTNGISQDASNFYSIKRFFETHPELSGCYPNLIFVVVPATDTRIEGPNSNLSKSLRCLKWLGLVSQRHPNVVAILSFCCSVSYKNNSKWERKMIEKKASIRRIVFKNLKVTAPVVLLENEYEDHELELDGEFTCLPNGERQPKNLYDACQKVLEKNSDHLGLLILNACFVKLNEKNPTLGHHIKATDANKEKREKKEEKFVTFFEKVSKEVKNDPIFETTDMFTKEENLNAEQERKVLELAVTLKNMGLENEEECKLVSEGNVQYFHDSEISEKGAKMLKKKFGITKKTVYLDSGHIVGKGYDILHDVPKPVEIMHLSTLEEKEFGFVLPNCAKVEKVNETRSVHFECEDEESKIKSRLISLGINLDVHRNVFKMGPRAGFNQCWKNSASIDSSTSEFSYMHEHRMVQVSIANFQENVRNGITHFTSDFTKAVKELPDKYVKNDQVNRSNFEKFFNRFGHFIVTSAFGGGAVEVKIAKKTLKSEGLKSFEEAKASIAASFQSDFPGLGGEIAGSSPSSSKAKSEALLKQSNIHWFGGSPDLHTIDTLTSPEKMFKWQTSLLDKPTLLTTRMFLEPISTVIGCIDEGKDQASYNALKDLLGGEFKRLVSRENDEEKRLKIKMEEAQKQANTRLATIKEPETSGFWAWALGILGAGLAVIGAFALLI